MRAYKFWLEPTPTYRLRAGLWVPTASVGGDGILTITLSHAKGGKMEQDVYGVEEVSPEVQGTRRFLLVNLTGDAQEQPYAAVVGKFTKCTCDGRMHGGRASCKHRDSLAHLIAAGQLPARLTQVVQGA